MVVSGSDYHKNQIRFCDTTDALNGKLNEEEKGIKQIDVKLIVLDLLQAFVGIYIEQNVTSEYYEEFDGERWML